jgi:DUF4097 and DUF4098 domain-containing protein YvlB
MFRNGMIAAAAVLLVAGAASADRPVDETVKADKNGTVSISNVAGSVKVTGWDKAEVKVTGTVDDEVEEVVVDAREGDVEIEVKLPRRSHHGGDADLIVQVPKGSELEIETVSADIEVSGVEGRLDLESVSGSVDVEGANAEADVSTVSGRITLSGKFPGVEAESVSGDIEVDGVSGEIDVSATSGRIEITGSDFDRVDCESMSGDVRFDGNPKAGADLSIEVFSGDAELMLPASLDARINVETHSGSITSDFGDDEVRREKYGPGAWFETEVGKGSASIDVTSFSGSVRLRKK